MTRRDGADDTGPPDDSGTAEEAETTGSGRSGSPDPGRGPPRGDTAPGAGSPSSDPRRIGSLAVTESDVVDALEAAARGGREIVLRVTPPFSGRMRARLHDAGAVDADDESGGDPARAGRSGDDGDHTPDAAPVHIPPERFVADPPAYPTVDDTEDELRASDVPYTRERHRERHKTAVAAWRRAVRNRLVESITVPTDAGATTVAVSYLG